MDCVDFGITSASKFSKSPRNTPRARSANGGMSGGFARTTFMDNSRLKVDNAVIMAAGLSSRFAPLSYEKPKGLIVVKGEVLIERQIRQLLEAGIADITVVVGYLKESFSYLKQKFGVRIIDNDDYYRYNNTSTLIRVLDKLNNTYICSSDNYFTQNVFEPTVDHAYYAATYFPGSSTEWGVICNSDGRIISIDHSPIDEWCMMGHVFFDAEFSSKFRNILQEEYKLESTRKELWESVYERHLLELDMNMRKYEDGIVLEFDSIDDLRKFDSTYIEDSGSAVMRLICRALNCSESDISGIKSTACSDDLLEIQFMCQGWEYAYKHSISQIQQLGAKQP